MAEKHKLSQPNISFSNWNVYLTDSSKHKVAVMSHSVGQLGTCPRTLNVDTFLEKRYELGKYSLFGAFGYCWQIRWKAHETVSISFRFGAVYLLNPVPTPKKSHPHAFYSIFDEETSIRERERIAAFQNLSKL